MKSVRMAARIVKPVCSSNMRRVKGSSSCIRASRGHEDMSAPVLGKRCLRVLARGFSTESCCNRQQGCDHQHPPSLEDARHPHHRDHKSRAHGVQCWSCGRLGGCCNFFCACGKIQPLVGHCSYFDTFHIPKQYDLDLKQLEREYWNLQKSLHPDRYGRKSRTEQDLSRDNSTFINVAYRTLKDPTLRAKYLLSLEGINALSEASKTADPSLLMEIMELREKVEEASSADGIRSLLDINRRAMEDVKAAITEAHRAKDYEKMLGLTTRLQYLSKVDHEARERLDQLDVDDGQRMRPTS